ncbi:MAG: putative amidophosphoribosyltransferase [Solidesulfovibrio magneticus str. Maddingley MBC34]|uniref:Putative amidophosphoribosyltransferase n=1 Tax=Solidesulfovibrio magneticus str. Maddingley MBC34 TaxID=1206767 RepID=K6GQB8_9BACT|nr:MAG: putative amidophosphoribosyltransferase [Solidesulfovibrio magneticus str. Maddingley MBC34]
MANLPALAPPANLFDPNASDALPMPGATDAPGLWTARTGVACLADWLGRLGRRLLAACDRCQACQGLLPADASLPLCPACRDRLAPRLGGFCPRCGAMGENAEATPGLCLDCRRDGRPWDGFAFHGRYEGLLRELVLGFKFHGRLGQGRLLAGFLAAAWRRAAARDGPGCPDGAPDLLVPTPLYPRRLAWRGFNQSLELARLLGREIGTPLAPLALARLRDTVPQSSLPGRERRSNLTGAFAADPAQVAGRRVLLVDDVMTTGATVETAAQALRRAGAARVDVAVAAR